ncbi:MAG TPA: PEP-CTERM sorting domain-containing protein [Verrucomicrobiae bacterium]
MAGTLAALELSVAPAKAAAALWVSAPAWSYSAAAADSPVGWAYFWGLSAGAGTYSWAYAFSDDGAGDAGYAFAEAAVAQGGMVGVDVGGVADPYAGVETDTSFLDPSDPGGYPTSKPGSDPFSSSYTVSGSGITFTGNGEELNGDDELQAFVYNGPTDMASLESELGAASSSGSTSSGDVTDLSTLAGDFGLIPLDTPIDDPGSINSLNFTENTGDIDQNADNVILVGMSEAESTPEPGAAWLAGLGLASLLIFRKRRAAAGA